MSDNPYVDGRELLMKFLEPGGGIELVEEFEKKFSQRTIKARKKIRDIGAGKLPLIGRKKSGALSFGRKKKAGVGALKKPRRRKGPVGSLHVSSGSGAFKEKQARRAKRLRGMTGG